MQENRFAGIDWASEEHAVCVVDERGRIVEGRHYRHDERGIRALCARLLALGVSLVAIERPEGLLIERLLDAGYGVIAVASEPAQRDATPVQRGGRQERQLRQLRVGRARPHGRSSLPDPHPRHGSHEGAESFDPGSGGLGPHSLRAGQPAV